MITDYLSNFTAFCMPLAIFLYWFILGYATLSLLRTKRHALQNLLLAPAIGFALLLLLVFWLNRLGLPVSHFASYLFGILLLLSGLILAWRKPFFPLKFYLPFAALFLLALFLTGRPLLEFGYDWISYGNDDMANYCLGATFFLNHAYLDLPDFHYFSAGKDYSLAYWFMYVPGLSRSGVELMLAQLSGVTHLLTLKVFMPLILAFHLALISTTGALVLQAHRYKKRIAFFTCLLLTFSALSTLGTLYQLIAQVAGLTLLIASSTLILQTFSIHKKYHDILNNILIAITVSALCVVYPEVLPFLALAFLCYFSLHFLKGWRPNRSFYTFLILSIGFIFVFLNIHLIAVFEFILLQIGHVKGDANPSIILFPYYLLPSGLANLWGLQAIAFPLREPLASLVILIGGLLTLLASLLTLRLVFLRRTPAAVIAFIMLGLGISLFKDKLGFSLFKLAMYIQPFILAVLVISLYELIKNKKWRLYFILFFVCSGFISLQYYVTRSRALTAGPFSEVAYGSHTKINQAYQQAIAKVPEDKLLLSDNFNSSLVKFQALISQDRPYFPLTSPFFFLNILKSSAPIKPHLPLALYDRYFRVDQAKTIALWELQPKKAQFQLHDSQHPEMDFVENNTCSKIRPCKPDDIFIIDTGLRSVINRQHFPGSDNFILLKYGDVANHLIFTESTIGSLYNSLLIHSDIQSGMPAIFNLEKDPIYPKQTIQAVGRYLLFRVIHPSQTVRLSMTITNMFDGDGRNQLPPAAVIGTERLNLPVIGRGSARVVSEPLSPQVVNGIPYIAIDMQIKEKKFPDRRKGLMQLYGESIPADVRDLTTLARDISLLSEEEYQRLDVPSYIDRFPQGLNNQNLVYSGIYEDGWFSERAFLTLKQPQLRSSLKIQGELPALNKDFTGATLTVSVDGRVVLVRRLSVGGFDLSVPVTSKLLGRRKIDLRFTEGQSLPNGDGRVAAAKIHFIGFV